MTKNPVSEQGWLVPWFWLDLACHVLVNLLLKVMEIAFQTLFYPDTSIFVWRVYPSLGLETCQSLNLLTLVWWNKNNRQIKEAKCHRQKFKSFCSSQLLLSCRRFVNISPLLNSGKPQFSKHSICKQRFFFRSFRGWSSYIRPKSPLCHIRHILGLHIF